MLKMKKLALAIVMATTLAGCANIGDSYQASLDNYKQYEDITKQYNIKDNWWALYNDAQLNRVVEQALANNKDLAKAAVSVNRALYSANLAGASLIPAFSGSAKSSFRSLAVQRNPLLKKTLIVVAIPRSHTLAR